MKNVFAVALLVAGTAVAAPTSFSDSEVDIRLLPEGTPVRTGNFVTFAAESTFKVPADAKLPAGTKMRLIWTVDCVKKEQRIVLAAVTVPGQKTFNVSREDMVAAAKKEPFVAPKDTVSPQVMAAVCAR